jgi:uncharacterized membrane protein YedE/YeeE
MDMIAPLAKVFSWGPTASSVIAILLGIGFGFFLERAGFGSAKTLAGVWYGYNFAVIRVMFTAIVVAMLGLFGLHYLGVLNLDLVYINGTYLWPQIVGGFIFGLGFNIGQYCPGTSAVAMATGKLDGLVFILGFLGGVVLFSFAFPLFEGFFNSSSMGRVTLPSALGLPAGVIVFAVVLVALGAFLFTHFLDRKLGNR